MEKNVFRNNEVIWHEANMKIKFQLTVKGFLLIFKIFEQKGMSRANFRETINGCKVEIISMNCPEICIINNPSEFGKIKEITIFIMGDSIKDTFNLRCESKEQALLAKRIILRAFKTFFSVERPYEN